MPRFQYEFDLKKVVRLVPNNGMPPTIVGEVEEYFETPAVPAGDGPAVPAKVRVVVRLDPKLRKETLDRILANPGMLSVSGVASAAGNLVMLPEAE